jgi:hypothetical protein
VAAADSRAAARSTSGSDAIKPLERFAETGRAREELKANILSHLCPHAGAVSELKERSCLSWVPTPEGSQLVARD